MACGYACPRDSDMQEAALGRAVNAPAYGDIVFWKGHVGFIAGDNLLLHANAHHMAVAEEAYDAACLRIEKAGGGPVTAIKRL
jgi:cell wall-associated NlpC family hydrolase